MDHPFLHVTGELYGGGEPHKDHPLLLVTRELYGGEIVLAGVLAVAEIQRPRKFAIYII